MSTFQLDSAEPTIGGLSRIENRWSALGRSIYNHRWLYVLLAPGVIYFLVFHYAPIYFVSAAFKDYNIFRGLAESEWVGLKHFKNLFLRPFFLISLRNTLIISFMQRILLFPVPIILALIISEIRHTGPKRLAQSLVYLPHFFSWVIVGGIFNELLSPNGGIVNLIIQRFGGEPIFFMANKEWFRWVLALSESWKEAGWGTIIYLASISDINPQLYEAAMIDGANKFQRLIYITLPAISVAIIVVFTLSLRKILLLFEQVFVMYNPAVAEVSETIGTYVYVVGIQQGDISFSIAVGLFQGFTSLIIVLGLNWFAKKIKNFELF